MARTGLCRSRNLRKIFRDARAARGCKFSGLGTYRFLLDGIRHLKIFVFQILMNPAHDSAPYAETEVQVIAVYLVVVISAPYRTCVVRREAAEPEVLVRVCRTGLAGYRHVVKPAGCTGTAFYDRFHRACEKSSRTVLDGSM